MRILIFNFNQKKIVQLRTTTHCTEIKIKLSSCAHQYSAGTLPPVLLKIVTRVFFIHTSSHCVASVEPGFLS